ncbi:transposable element Tcb2 transposase [Trichonephila clavipes]|uniref:Transposable element Tcb2 transposase n=1 Tax=Trichonephila clavipes TaxID=2585209 RepID=A0A8X6W7N1_TRICX|nr:transposable element Tcb2 transposase [Trichonephila clavipes]
MMEAWWSARGIALQLGRFDCVPAASSAAIQAQVAPSVCLLEPYEAAWLKDIWDRGAHYVCCPPFMPNHQHLRLEWCRARGNWTAAEWNQVVVSDESRFNLSSDDNRVRV